MQTSKIVLGGEYAITYKGELQAFRATEIATTRTLSGTTNVITGVVDGLKDEHGNRLELTLSPDRIDGELKQFKALVDEKNRKEAEARAIEEARRAQRDKAIRMLASAMGVPALYSARWGSDAYKQEEDIRKSGQPYVTADGYGIDIREHSLNQLIETLDRLGIIDPGDLR